MVQPHPGAARADEHAVAFSAAVAIEAELGDDGEMVLRMTIQDHDALCECMAELAVSLAGGDWLEDEAFVELCADAGMDYENLLQTPRVDTPEQEEDIVKKELGLLGEYLLLLHSVALDGLDPVLVLPKNAPTLYERISAPGIDVLAFSLDLDDPTTDMLLVGERVLIGESKASASASFASLARDAVASFEAIDGHRWQREIFLAMGDLEARGATAASQRIRWFIPLLDSFSVAWKMVLLSVVSETPNVPEFDRFAQTHHATAMIYGADVDDLRTRTFEFRH